MLRLEEDDALGKLGTLLREVERGERAGGAAPDDDHFCASLFHVCASLGWNGAVATGMVRTFLVPHLRHPCSRIISATRPDR